MADDRRKHSGRRAYAARLRHALESLARTADEQAEARAIETRVHRVAARSLGVDPEELTPEVSLTDELAADSLDLVELAVALEADLGISVPESALDDVRTYRELVHGIQALAHEQREREHRADGVELVRVCVVRGAGRGDGQLHRACWLTPYTAQIVADDALRAGRGARLEMSVPANLDDNAVGRLHDRFARLGDCEVELRIRRDVQLPPRWPLPRPHAA